MPPNTLRIMGTKAFVRLKSWTTSLTDEAAGPAIAHQAVSAWFLHAARGRATTNGPYAQLYTDAADIIWAETKDKYDNSGVGLIARILKPSSEQYCELARLYSVVYMMALYAQLTEDEMLLIAAALAQPSVAPIVSTTMLIETIMNSPAGPTLRRALVALESHQCHGDDNCARAAILWEDEERRSEEWVNSGIF